MKMKILQVSPFMLLHKEGNHYTMNSPIHPNKIQVDESLRELLSHCYDPVSIQELVARSDERTVTGLCRAGILIDPQEILDFTKVKVTDLEISTRCNWRCRFCPLSQHSKPPAVMTLDLFEQIVEKVSRYPSIESISINGFSEPALDPYFLQRIDIMKKHGVKLILNTNGSVFDREKADYVFRSGILQHLYFNLPSVDYDQFTLLTQSDTYEATMKNLSYVIEKGVVAHIICNGLGKSQRENVQGIKKAFGQYPNVKIIQNHTCDRAGIVKTEYHENIYVDGELCGCIKPINNIFVLTSGDFTFCGHDFHGNYSYGNIRDGEIEEILLSEEAKQIRKKVFGMAQAEPEFICRTCFDMKMRCVNRSMLNKFLSR